jgi:PAS domain S-box-containing protein
MTTELQLNEKVLHENAEEMKSTQEQLQKANILLQKKIEEEKLAQDRLHWLLENASEIISIYDENFRLKYISPSTEHILGYSVSEMMKGKDFERIDQKAGAEIRKAFEHIVNSPMQTIKIEYRFVRKDGSPIFLQTSIRNLLNDPSINGFVFNTRDITETKLVEKEQRMKSRMQSLSENSLDLILRISNAGVIHYVNPVVEDYTGISPETILNKPLNDIPFNKALVEILNNALHQVINKPRKFITEAGIPVTLGEKEGERILNFNVIPEFQEGELETILIVGHDITEAKRIEKQIKITNRKMQDSINYAERIQSSILPSTLSISKVFSDSFVYYMPKDVISGDFPWFYETEDAWFIAAIDCTGHGVPGALLSFIGFFLLNNITALNPNKSAGEICDQLNKEVRHTLKQDQKNPETRDGMDLALCKIYKNEDKLEFVGAHRPLYLLREGEISIFKGDRKAIGGIVTAKRPEKDFTNNIIDLRKGDKIFIFSDGLSDQMGGPEGSKYSPTRIRNILLENPGYTLSQFHDYFKEDFKTWLSNERQIDDVLLIGIGF